MNGVREGADILEILDIEKKQRQSKVSHPPAGGSRDKTEVKILELLDGGTKHIDILVRESGMKVEKVTSTLSMMELKGLLKNYGSGLWGV